MMRLLACSAFLFLAVTQTFAQSTITWSSLSDNTFSNGANWVGGVAPADSLTADIATFNGNVPANHPVLTASQSVQGLAFNFKDYTFSSTGGAVLTIGAGGLTHNAQFDLSVNMDIVLGANQTWNSASTGRTMAVTGNVSGNATLTKSGGGTLVLSGTNTYTGITTIGASGGTMQFAKTAALYNGDIASWTAANLTVNKGGTIAFNVGGTGEFTTGNVTTLITNLSTVNNNGLYKSAGGTLFPSIAFDTTNAAGGTFTISDAIANSTGTGGSIIGLTKLGSGTLVLTGANTYTGKTTIAAGTLTVSSIANLGVSSIIGAPTTAPNGTISIGTGLADNLTNITYYTTGTLLYTGGTTSTNRVINIAGNAILDSSGTGPMTFTSAFTAGSATTAKTLTLTGTSTGNTITGAIPGSGTTALTKTGAGSWILSGANTYTGATTVSDGTLTLGSATTLQSATGTVTVDGGTLATSVSATTLGGNLTFSTGTIALNGTSAGSLVLAAGKTFSMSGGTFSFTLGTTFDQISSAGSGSMSFTGGTLNFDTSGVGFSYTNSYQIFSGFGSTSFGGLSLAGYDTSGYSAAISDAGLLTFSAAIPEPATYVALAGALTLGFAAWRRRRASI